MPTYKCKLSESSLSSLIDNLRSYQKNVENLSNTITEGLTEKAKEHISHNLNSIANPDGNVEAKAGSYQYGNVGFAYMEGRQSEYLEYGTGVVGRKSPHPLASEAGWEYAKGPMIFTTKDGRVGWVYRQSGSDKWMFTEGIPAQMPVYNAAQELRKEVEHVVKEALN